MVRNVEEFTAQLDEQSVDDPKLPKNMGRSLQSFLIYISLLLDNVLLTVIVPILPNYLAQLHEADAALNVPNSMAFQSFDLHYVPRILAKHPLSGGSMINITTSARRSSSFGDTYFTTRDAIGNQSQTMVDIMGSRTTTAAGDDGGHWLAAENGAIGMLLAAKALVQLVVTPFVGRLTLRLGYRIPIVFGTFCLLVASLIFASGSSYTSLLLARSMHGIASACIGVCGMSLIAQLYPEDASRSRVMGVILGSVALGVLIGYPFGGILYDFVSKSAPFYILAACIAVNFVFQLFTMDLRNTNMEVFPSESNKSCTLLADLTIVKIIVAIWISTSAMAILEPCLPIWLMENMHPQKWQIGTVFIPDSIGYFVGTNFFASFAYRVGQVQIAVWCLLLVGLSCFIIPSATTVISLMIPHFTLGLGIGVLDAALVPMLATLVDARYANSDDDETEDHANSNYGAVYAIQQMSVSLAYSLGPIFGGQMAQRLGFRWLMLIVGSINIVYGLFLLGLLSYASRKSQSDGTTIYLTDKSGSDAQPQDYKRFYNTIEIP